jgi:hypothetical protein
MQTTKHEFTPYETQFFNNLRFYLETPLYFYGSIQRSDYFKGYSDIDVDIFTDNESSTISKLQTFLNVENNLFKQTIWKPSQLNYLIHGYKLMYKDVDNNLQVEISIYNEKYKHEILNDHNRKMDLPYYASIILIIIKLLFYKLNVISKQTYRVLKKKILSTMIGIPIDDFVTI